MTIINSYNNGSHRVTIYEDGTKIRERIAEGFPLLPESMDVKITNYCDAGCSFCHENSTIKGKDGNSIIIDTILQMHRGSEIAIGGGNPLASNMLDELLYKAKDKGIISNITINELHWNFNDLKKYIDNKLIYGIGYSFRNKLPEKYNENTVIHFIAGVHNVNDAIDALNRKHKILVLGYKNFGLGKSYAKNTKLNLEQWKLYLYKIMLTAMKNDTVMAFDTLATMQLEPKRFFKDIETYDQYYMGDEGTFSMYIDTVTMKYSKSSFSPKNERFDIENKSLKEIFNDLRY